MSASATSFRHPQPARALPPVNLVEIILDHARRAPARPALVADRPEGPRVVRYGALASGIGRFAAALDGSGLAADARVLLLLRPDPDVYAFALGVMASGRTLVLVDGRRGVRRLLDAIDHADAIVGPPALLGWWPLIPAMRRARRFTSLRAVLRSRGDARAAAEPRATGVEAHSPALVSFSSGNTGRAKVVTRTHGVLLAQHRALATAFPLDGDDVNLPGFPMATIHNLCCGTATVLPSADLRAMADAEPELLVALIERCGVTSISGAPAFLSRLSSTILERGGSMAHVRRVVAGGGPVGRALCADVLDAFPVADAHVLYGASEAEPISVAPMRDVLAAPEGEGFLVGRPPLGTHLKLRGGDGGRALVGEVLVCGPQVATRGGWHETGDIGRMDASGRLWLLGRVERALARRCGVGQPYVAEAIALALAGVRHAAHVAHRLAPDGELVVELRGDAHAAATLAQLRASLDVRGLAGLPIRRRRTIPMDARHASKVSRGALAAALEREGR